VVVVRRGFECAKVTAPIDWNRPATGTLPALPRPDEGHWQAPRSLLINPGGPGVGGAE
jgi:hypothetical protein